MMTKLNEKRMKARADAASEVCRDNVQSTIAPLQQMPYGSNQCVGPARFCNPYFRSQNVSF